MTTIWGNRRTKQLVTAALAGELAYSDLGILLHRSSDPAAPDIPATKRDAEVVAVLVDLGLLRRDETSGAITAAGAP
ncbi:MAG: hypothetical protein ACRDSN_00320 [Pseudonocardiaceae bacterium]